MICSQRRSLMLATLGLVVTLTGCKPPGLGAAKPPALGSLSQLSGNQASSPGAPQPTALASADGSALLGEGAPGQDSVGTVTASGDRTTHGVLLVHGLGMAGIGMAGIQAYLAGQGVPNVETIDLPGAGITSTMEEMAAAVAQHIQAMQAKGITKVDLVGHSMGGLVIREYLRTRRDTSVAVPTLITVATPNHGNGSVASLLEKVGMKSAISQMASNSDFIATINASAFPSGTRAYGLWTKSDDVVHPAESCLLPGGENFVFDVGPIGAHVAMALHPSSLEAIHKLLVGAPGNAA